MRWCVFSSVHISIGPSTIARKTGDVAEIGGGGGERGAQMGCRFVGNKKDHPQKTKKTLGEIWKNIHTTRAPTHTHTPFRPCRLAPRPSTWSSWCLWKRDAPSCGGLRPGCTGPRCPKAPFQRRGTSVKNECSHKNGKGGGGGRERKVCRKEAWGERGGEGGFGITLNRPE